MCTSASESNGKASALNVPCVIRLGRVSRSSNYENTRGCIARFSRYSALATAIFVLSINSKRPFYKLFIFIKLQMPPGVPLTTPLPKMEPRLYPYFLTSLLPYFVSSWHSSPATCHFLSPRRRQPPHQHLLLLQQPTEVLAGRIPLNAPLDFRQFPFRLPVLQRFDAT